MNIEYTDPNDNIVFKISNGNIKMRNRSYYPPTPLSRSRREQTLFQLTTMDGYPSSEALV